MNKEDKLKWSKVTKFGNADVLKPALQAFLLLIEAEKQKAVEQLEQTKKLLETMKNKK